ncbi:MAG: endonuclease MutS2, partial [Oscillospiraceae bacterium]
MSLNLSKHQKTLELDKILNLVAKMAQIDDSKERILSLTPSFDEFDVKKSLKETDQALKTIYRFSSPTISNLKNPGNSLKRAEIGSMLSPKELLSIAEVLRVIKLLCQWQNRINNDSSSIYDCSMLNEYFNMLHEQENAYNEIELCILSEDEISDKASTALADIRRKIKNAEQNAKSYLENMVHSQTKEKYLQEQIITMRDGRYVVPVKSEHKSMIKGLVHDTSSSGATVFIEPLAVVEANNKIKILLSEEKEEIERILYRLSALVGENSFEILNSYDAIIEIDVIYAKAKYALQTDSIMPEINTQGITILKKAKHPLIDKKNCVPINIEIGDKFDTLVVTGPNTGGKTVSLKTIGLCCLMTMCGLLIPCEKGSEICLYKKILVDIGDEQSIEQSLSTFSSHMKNIISILKEADSESLALIDELGSGTDPVEGAALAISIIESLRQKQCKILSTTHYAEIKVYALETKGVENACCEFDVDTLSPTYKLLIGVPGRSNAFAISQRLGLNENVVKMAKERISAENSRFEDVVSSLEQNRVELEKERENLLILKQKAENALKKAEEKLEKVTKDKELEIEKARHQAKKTVDKIVLEAESIIEELDNLRKQKDNPDFSQIQIKARQEMRNKLKTIENKMDPVKKVKNDYTLPRALKIGDDVLICDINSKGVVLENADSSGAVLIQAGIMKLKVKLDNLKLIEDNSIKNQIKSYTKTT